MRIIAGEFRGRKLLPPADDTTRPVTDRVKQSLFDILTPRLPGAHVFDCFAGTGSMGLECLSRGAASAVFFEADRGAYTRLVANVRALGVGDRSLAIDRDLFKWFEWPAFPGRFGGVADVVFLDPPYRYLQEKPEKLVALAGALESRHLAPGAVVVFRHDARDALPLPPLRQSGTRRYGTMELEFLEAGSTPSDNS